MIHLRGSTFRSSQKNARDLIKPVHSPRIRHLRSQAGSHQTAPKNGIISRNSAIVPGFQHRTMATSSSSSAVEFGEKYVTAGLSRSLNAVVEKGEGSYLTVADGRKMLDFTCGIGVTNLGE